MSYIQELFIIMGVPLAIASCMGYLITSRMKLISQNTRIFTDIKGEQAKGIEVGGVSLFPILLVALCVTVTLPFLLHITEMRAKVEPSTMRIMQLIVGCALLFLTGMKNDMYGTGLHTKTLALLITAAMFPATNMWINNLQGLFGIYEIPAWVGMTLTVLLVAYLTESITLIDGMEGLSAGLSCMMFALFLAFCIYGHFVLGIIIASAALGMIIPFSLLKMFHSKWHKAILGHSGTYILGYLLSYFVLGMSRQVGISMPMGMMMICVGIVLVPSLDVIRVIRSRVREHRGILTPDRNQIQHRLFRAGVRPAFVPPIIAAIILGFTLLNTIWVMRHASLTALLAIDIAVWYAILFAIRWSIRRHESKFAREKWQKEYGREAWEAEIPHDVIQRKQEMYGTLGLPEHFIQGEEVEFIPDGMNSIERNTKRLFDMLVSGICMVVFSPLFLVSYLLIKIDDGGPAIYKQERLGRFGRPFPIYKFRSMRLDAEKMGPALSHAGGDDDPRLTKAGRFLRAHHLDELPQLWNVFVGDMALIGYRPERKFFIDQIMKEDPRYAFLYQIRPGVTSYATLYNGYTDTMEKMLRRLELDLYYLGHRSWFLDVKVLTLTFLNIIFGRKF